MICFFSSTSSCAEDIHELEKNCFNDYWSLESIKKDMDNANSTWIAAYDSDILVGYACATSVCDESEINRIAVKKEYRSKGIGNSLLKKLISKLSQRCGRKIFLEVRESNKNAISLYRKNEFDTVGVRKKYYSAPVENALIMMLEIK